MQIKRYRGADMQEALQRAKEDLGADAVILSTRQVRGGSGTFGLFGKPMMEVTAARDTDGGELTPDMALAGSGGPKGRLHQMIRNRGTSPSEHEFVRQMMAKGQAETQSLLTPLQDEIQELRGLLQATSESTRNGLRDEAAVRQIRSEMGEIRQLLQNLSMQSAGMRDANYPENLVVLFQQLIFNGMEEKFARRLIEESMKNIPSTEIHDFSYVKIFLARMLMKIIKVSGGLAGGPGKRTIAALVGPTGVGKTTSVAKLASEQLLKYRRQVALITVDTFRIAAVEQLKVYAKIMGVPITVVNTKDEMRAAIDKFKQADVILIDTGGRSQRDDLQMSEIYTLFRGADDINIILALSATTKDSDLTEVTRRFGEIPLSAVMFTKLDESTTFGSLFNHAIRFKLPFAYLTTGQKVPEDIEVASKERLVDLLLNISNA
ncbi:MAG: flagellar biosynthesis protein FlhF [Candidatus Lambdaproteobacteria bacterium]|nr:flagellar biosynthesis protein FlhF [Candidatus Lambdaproteobacteria bacterium]